MYVKIYSHTNAEIDILYHFVCEHCGKDSGIKKIELTGHAGGEAVEEGKTVTMADVEALRAHARMLVERQLNKHKASVAKGAYPAIFDGLCPHCRKSQSWNCTGSAKRLFTAPLWEGLSFFACVWLIMTLVSYFSNWKIAILRPALIASGIGTLLGFATALADWIKYRRDTKDVTHKNKPDIIWPDINWIRIYQ